MMAETINQETIMDIHLFWCFDCQGFTPDEAIQLVERWEKTGESQLLVKSKMFGQQR